MSAVDFDGYELDPVDSDFGIYTSGLQRTEDLHQVYIQLDGQQKNWESKVKDLSFSGIPLAPRQREEANIIKYLGSLRNSHR